MLDSSEDVTEACGDRTNQTGLCHLAFSSTLAGGVLLSVGTTGSSAHALACAALPDKSREPTGKWQKYQRAVEARGECIGIVLALGLEARG